MKAVLHFRRGTLLPEDYDVDPEGAGEGGE
jgi:hypothetical protein